MPIAAATPLDNRDKIVRIAATCFFTGIILTFCTRCVGIDKKKIVKTGYLEDGRKYDIRKIDNDSEMNYLKTIYYKNSDSIYEQYGMKNDVRNGFDNYYSPGANRVKRLIWNNNRKIMVNYYDTITGNKLFEQYYYDVHDTDYPNQYFMFMPGGDTIKNKSFYCSVFNNKNVIKNGEEYVIKIVLDAPVYHHAYVRFCAFDAHFMQKSKKCDSMEMYHFSAVSVTRDYHPGWNYVSGEIVNYEDGTDPISGKKLRKEKHLFYRGNFYVE